MKKTRHRGFTLVEMMVVVTLLAVVAAIGALKLSKPNEERAVSGLAREIFARAAEARFLALSSGCQAQLRLDPADANRDDLVATVVLAIQPGMAGPVSYAPATDGVSKRRDARISVIAAGTSLGGPRPAGLGPADTVIFYPDGTARLQSTPSRLGATLYLQDTHGRHPYRVAIFGSTGFARVLSQ